jgi:8-oxo-dGTP pyrophosphatase MutT (NUDIX family)
MNRPTQEDGRVHGVIVGCQREDGRWLLIRRSENVAAPLKVCFPGGAVETGEDRDSAALREMREEVGLTVKLIGQVWRHDFSDKALTLFGYLANLNGEPSSSPGSQNTPQPCAHEVAEIMWLTADQAGSHPDAMPMTDRFVQALEMAASTG